MENHQMDLTNQTWKQPSKRNGKISFTVKCILFLTGMELLTLCSASCSLTPVASRLISAIDENKDAGRIDEEFGLYNDAGEKITHYRGQTKDGQFDGEGNLQHKDGTQKTGQFQNGKFVSGTKKHGKYYSIYEGATFEGTFKDEDRHTGTMTFPNGRTSEYKDGKLVKTTNLRKSTRKQVSAKISSIRALSARQDDKGHPFRKEYLDSQNYTGEEFPLFGEEGKPLFTDIRQGWVDDCWLLASVASIAFHHPEIIKNTFGNLSDEEHYTVNLHNNKKPIKVHKSFWTVGSRPAFSQMPDNKQWVAVLEKAVAKSLGGYEKLDRKRANGQLSSSAKWWKKSRFFDECKALTGQQEDVEKFDTRDTGKHEDIWKQLLQNTKEKYPMTFGFSHHHDVKLPQGLASGHRYSLLEAKEVEVKGESLKVVRLYNPYGENHWGNSESKSEFLVDSYPSSNDSGEFWMPFDKFMKYCQDEEWHLFVCKITDATMPKKSPLGAIKECKEAEE